MSILCFKVVYFVPFSCLFCPGYAKDCSSKIFLFIEQIHKQLEIFRTYECIFKKTIVKLGLGSYSILHFSMGVPTILLLKSPSFLLSYDLQLVRPCVHIIPLVYEVVTRTFLYVFNCLEKGEHNRTKLKIQIYTHSACSTEETFLQYFLVILQNY